MYSLNNCCHSYYLSVIVHVAAVERKRFSDTLKGSSCFKRHLSVNTVRNERSHPSLFVLVQLRFIRNERSVDSGGLVDLPQGTSWLRVRALL